MGSIEIPLNLVVVGDTCTDGNDVPFAKFTYVAMLFGRWLEL